MPSSRYSGKPALRLNDMPGYAARGAVMSTLEPPIPCRSTTSGRLGSSVPSTNTSVPLLRKKGFIPSPRHVPARDQDAASHLHPLGAGRRLGEHQDQHVVVVGKLRGGEGLRRFPLRIDVEQADGLDALPG